MKFPHNVMHPETIVNIPPILVYISLIHHLTLPHKHFY